MSDEKTRDNTGIESIPATPATPVPPPEPPPNYPVEPNRPPMTPGGNRPFPPPPPGGPGPWPPPPGGPGPNIPGAFPGSKPGPWPGTIAPPPPPGGPYYEGCRQYIGARYVPAFAVPITWQANMVYENLTIISHMGVGYISKRHVPPGIEPPNDTYWQLIPSGSPELQELKQRVEALEDQTSGDTEGLNNRLTAVENTTAGHTASIATLTTSTTKNTLDIAEMKGNIAVNKSDIATVTARVDAHDASIQAVREKAEANETAISALRNNVDTNTGKIESLEQTLEDLEPKVTKNTEDIAALQTASDGNATEITAIKAKNVDQDNDIALLQTATATNGQEITAIKTKNTAQDAEINTLKTTTANNAAAITAVNEKNTEQDGKLTDLESKNDSQDEEIAALKTRVQKCEQDILNLTAGGGDQLTQITTLQTDVAKLKTDLTTVQTQAATNSTDIAALKTRVENLETNVATAKREIEAIKTDIGEINNQIDTLRKLHVTKGVVIHDKYFTQNGQNSALNVFKKMHPFDSAEYIAVPEASFYGQEMLQAIQNKPVDNEVTDVIVVAGLKDAATGVKNEPSTVFIEPILAYTPREENTANNLIQTLKTKYPKAKIFVVVDDVIMPFYKTEAMKNQISAACTSHSASFYSAYCAAGAYPAYNITTDQITGLGSDILGYNTAAIVKGIPVYNESFSDIKQLSGPLVDTTLSSRVVTRFMNGIYSIQLSALRLNGNLSLTDTAYTQIATTPDNVILPTGVGQTLVKNIATRTFCLAYITVFKNNISLALTNDVLTSNQIMLPLTDIVSII